MTERGPVAIEVRPAIAPDGATAVLLQLPDGYALLDPDDARALAARLTMVAEEC